MLAESWCRFTSLTCPFVGGGAEPSPSGGNRTPVTVTSPGGGRFAGVGGFVNISQSARRVIFACPFRADGLTVTSRDGALQITRDGAKATGAGKADIVAKAVEGPITSMISATALQMHPRCTVIVDEAAAAKLQGVDYYRWIFANEPEWEAYRS